MTSAFDNEIAGLFNMGATVDLGGSPNTLTNKGVVSPGGENVILTTALTGKYTQTDDGAYLVAVDFSDNDPNPGNPNEADLIEVSGVAELDGLVIVDALNGAYVEPDQSGKVLILAAASESGDPVLDVTDTEVVDYEISYDTLPGGKEVYLEWIVDFTPDGVDDNETISSGRSTPAIPMPSTR